MSNERHDEIARALGNYGLTPNGVFGEIDYERLLMDRTPLTPLRPIQPLGGGPFLERLPQLPPRNPHCC